MVVKRSGIMLRSLASFRPCQPQSPRSRLCWPFRVIRPFVDDRAVLFSRMGKGHQPLWTPLVRRGVLALCLVLVSCRCVMGEQHVTRRTNPVILVDVQLPVTPKQFKDLWMDTGFNLNYLQRIGDSEIKLGQWKTSPSDTATSELPSPPFKPDRRLWALERLSTSCHPVRTRVPGFGMPKCAVSSRGQWMGEFIGPRSTRAIVLRETNDVAGVPFSDRFSIETTYVATWTEGMGARLCISQVIVFKQAFLLEKVVERNAEKEARETALIWVGLAAALHGGAAVLGEGEEKEKPWLTIGWGKARGEATLRTGGMLLFTGLLTSYLFLGPKRRGGTVTTP